MSETQVMTDDRDLLIEIADSFPWKDVNTYNVCGFCDGTWRHREDCLWVRVRRHLGLDIPDDVEGDVCTCGHAIDRHALGWERCRECRCGKFVKASVHRSSPTEEA